MMNTIHKRTNTALQSPSSVQAEEAVHFRPIRTILGLGAVRQVIEASASQHESGKTQRAIPVNRSCPQQRLPQSNRVSLFQTTSQRITPYRTASIPRAASRARENFHKSGTATALTAVTQRVPCALAMACKEQLWWHAAREREPPSCLHAPQMAEHTQH